SRRTLNTGGWRRRRTSRIGGDHMAKIVLGMGSSHAPQLRLTPDEWYKRVNADKQNSELWFRGKTYTFPELVDERRADHFERQLSTEKAQERFDACQRAIGHLGRRRSAP